MNHFFSNLYYFKQLLLRLGIVLIIFTLIKIFFYSFNNALFPLNHSIQIVELLAYALRFDVAAIIYINSLFIILSLIPFSFRENPLYKKIQKFIFLSFNGIAFAFELIDIGFFKFASRRTIGSDLNLFNNTSAMIPGFIAEYWFLPLALVILVFVLYYFYNKVNPKKQTSQNRKRIQIGLFIFGLLAFGIAARGGLQLRPIMPLTALQHVEDIRLAPLVSNTNLNLLFSIQQDFIDEENYFTEKEQKLIFDTQRQYHFNQKMDKKNVFLIVLESFGQEHLSHFHPTLKTTPFLDTLISQSFHLEQSYANGLRSTKGIVSISSSIPDLMKAPLMFSAYQSNEVDGMAKLLGEQGYTSGFFHGANPGSMEFERYAKLSGFQEYHDRTEFDNDQEYDGQWGIWDAPFFQYSIDQVNQYQQPFYALLFSLTSHHPYKTPDWFEKEYPEMEPIHRSVRYTDYALKSFFEKAKKMPWYENTIFVITADHIGLSVDDQYQTRNGRYKVPILIFDPSKKIKGKQKGIAQQIDIMPTLLDLLKYDQPFSAFGESMFDTLRSNQVFQYYSDVYQVLDEKYLLLFDKKTSFGLFEYKKDTFLTENLIRVDSIDFKPLETTLKAVIQQHHREMIHNELGRGN